VKSPCIVTVSMILALSACSTQPARINHPNPLPIAECPELGPVSHKTFGDVVSAYLSLIEQYHKCRSAALPSTQPK
jgi:hypothetical protein